MANEYQKVVVGIISLLLAIIIGIMVYWETATIDQYDDSFTETFTSDKDGTTFTRFDGTTGSNYTGVTIELDYSANSISNITCWNVSGGTGELEDTPTSSEYGTNGKYLTINADSVGNFTQINVTYVSNIANTESDASDMASTVFGIAPIITLVIIASVLIAVIYTLGSGGRKGGL